jgi:multidrug efflux system membrane fusion protein
MARRSVVAVVVAVSALVLPAGVGMGGGAGVWGQSAGGAVAARGFDAHTEPSKRSRVNFVTPGVVAEVLVKAGDAVKQGAVLLKLDDRQDRKLLEALELEGKSTLKIDAANADLAQKRVELERKQRQRADGGAASELEVEEAKVAVLIREIQVRVEEMTRLQKELEAARQAVKVEQMAVVAPFDGVVERIELQVGETPDGQKAAVTVVKNDVLWVNVNLPTAMTLKLKAGDELDVKYKDTSDTVKGKVIFLSPFADAASETRLVRLEVQNTLGLPAGLGVVVAPPPGAVPTAAR